MSGFLKKIDQLNKAFAHKSPEIIIEQCLNKLFKKKVAYVCSFGSESAVILNIISKIDKNIPIIFLNTHFLFNETISYKNMLIKKFGLKNLIETFPENNDLKINDLNNDLWRSNPDKCCHLRKVKPLKKELKDFDGWISGRKSYHKGERESLNIFEIQDSKIVINPLINQDLKSIENYFKENCLPKHPLIKKNYLSIGCTHCTSPVKNSSDMRSGRWKHLKKTECGIYNKN